MRISLVDTYKVIIGKTFGVDSLLDGLSKSKINIVWTLRFPRVLMALITGAGLALCGAVMQPMVNKPIAEPYILGISSGATFGATLMISLSINKGLSVFGSSDSIMSIKFWTMGSLAEASWSSLIIPGIVFSISVFFFITQSSILNTMQLGDETAVTLGVNLPVYRDIYMIIVAILTGVLVSATGLIGFVGLIIPHISRSLVGTNHKRVLPIVVLLGAIFLIWSDVLARTLVKNAELPIGIFTALVGAPFFIYIVVKRGYAK